MVIWGAGWLCEPMCLVRLDVCDKCGQGPSMVFVHLWAVSACGVQWLWALSVWSGYQCMVCWSVCVVCESVYCIRVFCGSVCVMSARVAYGGYDSEGVSMCGVCVYVCGGVYLSCAGLCVCQSVMCISVRAVCVSVCSTCMCVACVCVIHMFACGVCVCLCVVHVSMGCVGLHDVCVVCVYDVGGVCVCVHMSEHGPDIGLGGEASGVEPGTPQGAHRALGVIIRTRKSAGPRPSWRAGSPQGPGLWHHLSPSYLLPSSCFPKPQEPRKPRACFLSSSQALGTGQGEEHSSGPHVAHSLTLLLRQDFPHRGPGRLAPDSSPAPSPGGTMQVTCLSEAHSPEPWSSNQTAGLAQGGQRGLPCHM